MSAPTAERVDELAEVLAEHRLHASMNICTGCDWRATPGVGSLADQHEAHRAQALAPLVAHMIEDEEARCPVSWCAYPMPHAHSTSGASAAGATVLNVNETDHTHCERSYTALAASASESSQRALRYWGAWRSARRRAGAVRPAAEVRAEALRPVRDLILDLNADADYLVPKRHLGDRLRAALAEEGEDRG